jgi:hypothetical protein
MHVSLYSICVYVSFVHAKLSVDIFESSNMDSDVSFVHAKLSVDIFESSNMDSDVSFVHASCRWTYLSLRIWTQMYLLYTQAVGGHI